jgi:hypothetical protein
MKRNLLLREVVNNKAYYRPSDDWLLAEVGNVKAMSIKDKLKYMSEEEKQELLSLL